NKLAGDSAGFWKGGINLASSLTKQAVTFGVHLGGAAIQDGGRSDFGSLAGRAFDNMGGLSVNLIDFGAIASAFRDDAIGAGQIDPANKESIAWGESFDRLRGTGININLMSSGASLGVGQSSINLMGNMMQFADGMNRQAQAQQLANQIAAQQAAQSGAAPGSAAYQSAFQNAYQSAYAMQAQQLTYGGIAGRDTGTRLGTGLDQIHIGFTTDMMTADEKLRNARGLTRQRGTNGRDIYLGSLGRYSGVDLAHEGMRDGKNNGASGQQQETREAVLAHVRMAMETGAYLSDPQLATEVAILQLKGPAALAAYADQAYDSSGDYLRRFGYTDTNGNIQLGVRANNGAEPGFGDRIRLPILGDWQGMLDRHFRGNADPERFAGLTEEQKNAVQLALNEQQFGDLLTIVGGVTAAKSVLESIGVKAGILTLLKEAYDVPGIPGGSGSQFWDVLNTIDSSNDLIKTSERLSGIPGFLQGFQEWRSGIDQQGGPVSAFQNWISGGSSAGIENPFGMSNADKAKYFSEVFTQTLGSDVTSATSFEWYTTQNTTKVDLQIFMAMRAAGIPFEVTIPASEAGNWTAERIEAATNQMERNYLMVGNAIFEHKIHDPALLAKLYTGAVIDMQRIGSLLMPVFFAGFSSFNTGPVNLQSSEYKYYQDLSIYQFGEVGYNAAQGYGGFDGYSNDMRNALMAGSVKYQAMQQSGFNNTRWSNDEWVNKMLRKFLQ
ncbi:MAG: hypothetical protein H7246_23565, partial [Phycisphaerae bacterium]|nr:hypothetical protein [Saprospiraceae bacterium]